MPLAAEAVLPAAGSLVAAATLGTAPGAAGVEPSTADVVALVVFVTMAIVLSFLCSIAEAALLSTSPSYIANLAKRRPRRAELLARLRLEKVDRSLAAILTLNTIAHTVGAVEAGSKAAVVFGSAWIGLFSALLTLAILWVSEIVPKTIGAVHWQKLAGPTALFVQILIVVLYPLVRVSESLTRFIARGRSVHAFSRDEFVALARIGHESGLIEDHESRIIRSLFRFGSRKVAEIMTPRTVMEALPAGQTVGDAMEVAMRSAFSRLPIYETDLDDLTGFVLKDEILALHSQGMVEVTLRSIRRELPVVPESISLARLLQKLLDLRQHIAVVADEYGGTKGIVTLEDVVETLLGVEIMDEMDGVEDMQELARQLWARRAHALGLASDGGEQEPGRAGD